MSDTAFMGLGVMGRPMAGHPRAGGHAVHTVKHRSELPAATTVERPGSTRPYFA